MEQVWSHYASLMLDWDMTSGFSHNPSTWWRHQMETFSALLAICAENSPVSGEFPAQRPVTRSFDGFFFICVWINGCVNNREAGDLTRYRAHDDVTVMNALCVTYLGVWRWVESALQTAQLCFLRWISRRRWCNLAVCSLFYSCIWWLSSKHRDIFPCQRHQSYLRNHFPGFGDVIKGNRTCHGWPIQKLLPWYPIIISRHYISFEYRAPAFPSFKWVARTCPLDRVPEW